MQTDENKQFTSNGVAGEGWGCAYVATPLVADLLNCSLRANPLLPRFLVPSFPCSLVPSFPRPLFACSYLLTMTNAPQ